MAKDCDLAGGMRVILSDHMKKIWREIGFQPASFTLPTGDDANEENDIPISENSRFRRSDKLADQSEDIEDKFVGMTIANISLECTDEEVRKFIADNVSDDLDEEQLDIVRDMRKTVVTITRMLNSQTIKNAMLKINFSDCKQKFFGRPLFCRPLRDITPEKINTVEKTISTEDKTSSTPTHDQQTGTISKIIPGLPSEEQQRDLSKKKKKERQRKLKEKMNKEDIEGKEKKQKQIQNLSAFDIMMKTRHLQNMAVDPRKELSFGSSPNLKRGSDELSSPNSPLPILDYKKNKSKESAVVGDEHSVQEL